MPDPGYILLASGANPLKHVVAHKLFSFELFGYEVVVTNHMFMVVLATVLMICVLPLAVRKKKGHVRTGFGALIETVCSFLREEVARPFLGDKTDNHIGFIWTVFYFILTLNLLGMIPMGAILYMATGKGRGLEGAATANIWVAGALGIVAFFTIHIAGMKDQGVAGYWKNFAPHVPWPMMPFIFTLELIGALVKPFSLAIRLFANIFAGHVVIATLLGFSIIFNAYAVGAPSVLAVVLISFLELFVAFLQAYIFTFLTTIYIGFAVNPDH